MILCVCFVFVCVCMCVVGGYVAGDQDVVIGVEGVGGRGKWGSGKCLEFGTTLHKFLGFSQDPLYKKGTYDIDDQQG